MRNEQDVLYGAKQTLDEVNKRLNASIRRNGGAKTCEGVVNVFNDVLANLHMMELDIIDAQEVPKEDGNDVPVFIILGGV